MMRAFLFLAAGLCFTAGAGVVYFMNGHEVAAFLLILTSAVLLVGACVVHALDVLAVQLSRTLNAD